MAESESLAKTEMEEETAILGEKNTELTELQELELNDNILDKEENIEDASNEENVDEIDKDNEVEGDILADESFDINDLTENVEGLETEEGNEEVEGGQNEDADAEEGAEGEDGNEVEDGNDGDVGIGDDGDEEAKEEEEEEEEDSAASERNFDPNVMPQVNVAVLAKRKWQVKVYPLKPADFVSGEISRVFKNAKESLLYVLSPGKFARGKGEMYISTVNQTIRVVNNLMKLDYFFHEINLEIIKKNDESAVEEKAYMRFDSKMAKLLFLNMGPIGGMGRKRERLIGSVFVKNLPVGTTKDMLRVMFPFAQEINFNPEKFKDGTARLVLKSRESVIPCLKAFAKVELGGNVLELHPLEKKKRARSEDEDAPATKHRRSESAKRDVEKEESSPKEGASSKGESKTEEREKKGSKTPQEKKGMAGSRSSSTTKPSGAKKEDTKHDQDKSRSHGDDKHGGSRTDGKERATGSRDSRFKSRGSLNAGKARTDGTINRRGIRGRVNRQFSGKTDYGRGAGRGLNRSGTYSRSPRGGGLRNYGHRNMGAGMSDVAMNAEATKEMVILQSQLSMAIKNQIAMLNQTQMAVEQAKKGASSLGLGADSRESGSSGMMSGSRGVDRYAVARQAAMEQTKRGNQNSERQYGDRNRGHDRGSSGRGGGGGYNKRRGRGAGGMRNQGGGMRSQTVGSRESDYGLMYDKRGLDRQMDQARNRGVDRVGDFYSQMSDYDNTDSRRMDDYSDYSGSFTSGRSTGYDYGYRY